MEALFEAWKSRSKSLHVCDPEKKPNSNYFNKNDKNMLQGILMMNHRHQKRPIDEDFMIKQRESKGTEVIEGIAPYTTDKTDIFKRLEEDRSVFLKKKLKGKEEE